MTINTSYYAEVMADSPVGYWKLDELTGSTMLDSSGNGRHGAYGALATLGASPLISTGNGISIAAQGLETVATVPDSAALRLLGDFTIEAWIQTSSGATEQWIAAKEDGNVIWPSWRLEIFGSKLTLSLWTSNTPSAGLSMISPVAVNDGIKHHVAVSKSGADVSMYIDGVLVASEVFAGQIWDTAAPVGIGCRYAPGYDTGALVGMLDEVAIYATGLPAARIAAHYTSGGGQSPAPDGPSAYKDPALISQYANSPTLLRLVSDMHGYIHPAANFDRFLSFVWDIRTAQSWGLDILGRIVGISRRLSIPDAGPRLGFDEGQDYQPFGQASFYAEGSTNTYILADEAYRVLILVKALLNISNSTAPAINRLLQSLFAGRGRCFVADIGSMQMLLVFEFELQPFELSILTQSTAIPRPAAVGAHVLLTTHFGDTFGFAEAGQFQPFGQGAFFNPAASLIQTN